MEQRKLIKLGNSSFAIALPKEWVDKAGLKKGEYIFLEKNNNGELIISPNFKREEERKVELDLKNKSEEVIKKNLHASYTKGYNVIVLKGVKNRRKIKEILNGYLSFEIIDSNDEQIVLKDFFDVREAKFESFVRRIDNNLREMFDLVLSQLKRDKLEVSSLKEVDEIDKAVNKFYFLCSRIFLKGVDNPTILNILKMDGGKLFSNWWISFNLESLGDGLKYVLKWIYKLDVKDKDNFYHILSNLRQNYIKGMEAFYDNNPQKAFEVIEATKKIRLDIEKLEKEHSKTLKITQALDVVEKNIYQNAKMVFYMRF